MAPQVVLARKGHPLVTRRTVRGEVLLLLVRVRVLGGGLAGGYLAEAEGIAGDQVAGDGEGA